MHNPLDISKHISVELSSYAQWTSIRINSAKTATRCSKLFICLTYHYTVAVAASNSMCNHFEREENDMYSVVVH